ncbi:hypothetical protein [Pseudomonas sp. dw_358]|uniref:hypothetical protein n=1 Tax=Pseudomonas sp. dw_358 TaxID=2720083 RepID=UPI001BD345AB|nr:hypothetical protein [Pseudomonas sp. dw_358]
MTRSAYEIAATGLTDLCTIQEAFNELQALFVFLQERVPEESFVNATAQLGIAVIEGWSEKAWQWAECMDNELDDLPEEQEVCYAKMKRLCAMRATHLARAEQ